MNDEYTESVTQRLQLATGDTSYRQIGVLTGTHPETVRRYMNGQSPSAAFLSSISNNFGISGEWLLTGRGPMLTKDILAHILQSSSSEALLAAVSTLFDNIFIKLAELDRRIEENQSDQAPLPFKAQRISINSDAQQAAS